MEMKLVLVDSNEELRGDLWMMLSLHRSFRLVAELNTNDEAVSYVQTHEVDVIFINIQPADARITSQGTHLAAIFHQEFPDIQTVIYSDSHEDAYDSYRAQAAGYLLLPFDPLEVQKTVNRLSYIYDLQQAKRETANRSIMIKTRSGYQLIRLQDILFVEHINRSNRIVTEDGKEIALLGYSMAELEKMLEKRGFFRCHQSFIVNLSKVTAIQADNDAKKYAVKFNDSDGEIMVSREKYMAMVSLLREKFAGLND